MEGVPLYSCLCLRGVSSLQWCQFFVGQGPGDAQVAATTGWLMNGGPQGSDGTSGTTEGWRNNRILGRERRGVVVRDGDTRPLPGVSLLTHMGACSGLAPRHVAWALARKGPMPGFKLSSQHLEIMEAGSLRVHFALASGNHAATSGNRSVHLTLSYSRHKQESWGLSSKSGFKSRHTLAG